MTLSRRRFLQGAISAAALAALPFKMPEHEAVAVPQQVPITEADLEEGVEAELVDVKSFALYSQPAKPDTLFVSDTDDNLIMTSNKWSINVHNPLGHTRDGSIYQARPPEWSINFEIKDMPPMVQLDGRELFIKITHPSGGGLRGRLWLPSDPLGTYMTNGRDWTFEISGEMSDVVIET